MKRYRRGVFARFAKSISYYAGHPVAFGAAAAAVVAWALTGSRFHFSDTWQLVINTATTVVTFLMVFLIQNTQNRDSQATQIKLDEIIRALEGAHNALLDLEELSDEELARMKRRYEALAEKARKETQKGRTDTGRPRLLRGYSPRHPKSERGSA